MTWHDALLWVLAALCLHALGTNLRWLGRADLLSGRATRLARAVSALEPTPLPRAMGVLYLVGLPAAALAVRVVTPEGMGLAPPRSAASVAQSLAVAGLAVIILVATWTWLAPEVRPSRRVAVPAIDTLPALALETALREAHWSFLRAAMLTLSAGRPDIAVAVATGVAAIEAWTDPSRRASMTEPTQAALFSQGAAAAIVSGYAFLASGSSVLAWFVQFGTCAVLATAVRRRAAEGMRTTGRHEPTIV